MKPIPQATDRLIVAPADRRSAVVELMRSARATLILSIFRCDDFTIIDELASAVQRGVRVRVLMTQRARGWRKRLKDLSALLKSTGAEVQPYENPVMKYHAKYIVADGGPALVTSINLTRKCFENTSDFLIFSDDAQIVSGLKVLFETDSAGASIASMPQPAERLIIGPEYSRRRLIQMLADAAESIRIIDHRLTDPEILSVLLEKRRQGVVVQLVGNSSAGGLICHGRMILIDQKTAIIGSTHLSRVSLDLRREVAIVTEEPGIAAELYDCFESMAINEESLIHPWATQPGSSEDEDDDEEE